MKLITSLNWLIFRDTIREFEPIPRSSGSICPRKGVVDRRETDLSFRRIVGKKSRNHLSWFLLDKLHHPACYLVQVSNSDWTTWVISPRRRRRRWWHNAETSANEAPTRETWRKKKKKKKLHSLFESTTQASTISQSILKGRVYSSSGRVRDKSEKQGESATEREREKISSRVLVRTCSTIESL